MLRTWQLAPAVSATYIANTTWDDADPVAGDRFAHFDFRMKTTRSPSGAKSNASHCSFVGSSTPVSTKGPISSPTSATRMRPSSGNALCSKSRRAPSRDQATGPRDCRRSRGRRFHPPASPTAVRGRHGVLLSVDPVDPEDDPWRRSLGGETGGGRRDRRERRRRIGDTAGDGDTAGASRSAGSLMRPTDRDGAGDQGHEHAAVASEEHHERRFEPRDRVGDGVTIAFTRATDPAPQTRQLDRVPQIGCGHPVEAGEAASKVIHRGHPGGLGGGVGRGSGWPARPGCSCPAGRRSGGSGDRRSRRGSPRLAARPAAGGRLSAGRDRRRRPRGRRRVLMRPGPSRRTFRAPRLIWKAARHTQAAGSRTAGPRRSSWA